MTRTATGARAGHIFGGILLIGVVAILVLGWRAPIHAVRAAERQALWQVVRACVAGHGLTGAAFPCLRVQQRRDENEGYVVLRPPVGTPDTILTPTRKSIGIEDPWLQSRETPNYFEAAWRARGLANGVDDESVALGVNSRLVRSQDQLHIHIGCLVSDVKSRLSAAAPRLPVGEWAPAASVIPGADLWSYRTGSDDIAKIAPFRLIAAKWTESLEERARLTLIVASIPITGRNELFVLAARADPARRQTWIAAEEVVDPRCAKGSRGAE